MRISLVEFQINFATSGTQKFYFFTDYLIVDGVPRQSSNFFIQIIISVLFVEFFF